MRLLRVEEDGECSLIEAFGTDIPPYAILSHTWGQDHEEVTLKDIVKGRGKTKAGFQKIRFCAEQVIKDGLKHFWIDTCCIRKTSDAELSEAINSMFRWYRDAVICYVYLSDVSFKGISAEGWISAFPNEIDWPPQFRRSRWFTRGWTLQELIAPRMVEFFSVEGTRLCDKHSMKSLISTITGLPTAALEGKPLSHFSVDERMSWARMRQTKRTEDAAYSLFGLFDVHMPLIYGEGRQKALNRLRNEIQRDQLKSSVSPNPFQLQERGERPSQSLEKGSPGNRPRPHSESAEAPKVIPPQKITPTLPRSAAILQEVRQDTADEAYDGESEDSAITVDAPQNTIMSRGKGREVAGTDNNDFQGINLPIQNTRWAAEVSREKLLHLNRMYDRFMGAKTSIREAKRSDRMGPDTMGLNGIGYNGIESKGIEAPANPVAEELYGHLASGQLLHSTLERHDRPQMASNRSDRILHDDPMISTSSTAVTPFVPDKSHPKPSLTINGQRVIAYLLEDNTYACGDSNCEARWHGKDGESTKHYREQHEKMIALYSCPVVTCNRSVSEKPWVMASMGYKALIPCLGHMRQQHGISGVDPVVTFTRKKSPNEVANVTL